MRLQPEDPRPIGRVVATNPLEKSRPVVNDVGANVNGRLIPGDELTVIQIFSDFGSTYYLPLPRSIRELFPVE